MMLSRPSRVPTLASGRASSRSSTSPHCAVEVHVPPRELCTDNAAMIASAARFAGALPYPDYLGLDVYATGELALIAR